MKVSAFTRLLFAPILLVYQSGATQPNIPQVRLQQQKKTGADA
jgi:hypothetical protein